MSAAPWERAVAEALGAPIASVRPVGGGDINEAYALRMSTGAELFVKTHAGDSAAMFQAEARGLAWLAEAAALAVPEVVAVSAPGAAVGFLVLTWVRGASRAPDFDEALGRGLAHLHRAGAPGFGLDHDNFLGRLPQSNRPHATWATFYREERLLPQLHRAASLLGAPLLRRFDRLLDALESVVGPEEPPARLHGDLWGGNVMAGPRGEPVLIDPAVHGGHRELDLAMMQLFGGFGPRVFAAYDEVWPRAPGHAARVPLYQLYYLLAHVNLFGRSYVPPVAHALDAALHI